MLRTFSRHEILDGQQKDLNVLYATFEYQIFRLVHLANQNSQAMLLLHPPLSFYSFLFAWETWSSLGYIGIYMTFSCFSCFFLQIISFLLFYKIKKTRLNPPSFTIQITDRLSRFCHQVHKNLALGLSLRLCSDASVPPYSAPVFPREVPAAKDHKIHSNWSQLAVVKLNEPNGMALAWSPTQVRLESHQSWKGPAFKIV